METDFTLEDERGWYDGGSPRLTSRVGRGFRCGCKNDEDYEDTCKSRFMQRGYGDLWEIGGSEPRGQFYYVGGALHGIRWTKWEARNSGSARIGDKC